MTRPTYRATLRLESLEDRAVPATFNVTTTQDVIDPADGKRSLREAITAANNLAGVDVIVLPAGVYKLALAGAGDDANATGDFDVTDAVTVRGAGAGISIIDGQQLDRLFDVAGTAPSSIKVVLEKMTIRKGDVTGDGGGTRVGNADLVVRDSAVNGNRASVSGGGISNGFTPNSGDLKLVRTTVARNVAGLGAGGLALFGSGFLTIADSAIRRNVAGSAGGGGIVTSNASLSNSTISDNFSGHDGGGIVANNATLTNCTITGNRAVGGGFGGGIRAGTSVTLTNCTVSGNSTEIGDGGGISTSTATLTNCTVSGNLAGGSGGGVLASTATLTRSTFSGNLAKNFGGGVVAATVTLTNSTLSGNAAGLEGGGLFANSGTLLNCTIVENIANTGGGVFHGSTSTLSVRNTIIALNLVEFGGTGPDVSGDVASLGHNLVGDGSGSTGFGVNFDIVGTSANPIDPKLGPLALNGGKTKTHALLAGSPAIDRGDNANLPPTDQRGAGFARRKDGNGDGIARVDIGAFER
jgi:CSLREA domain-containing protein